MHIKVYSKEYSGVICAWLAARDLDTGLIQDLPRTGYVAIEDGQVIAAGFLRHCEGSHGLLDSFITDPTAPPKDRDKAMDLLLNRLINHSKKLGIKQLIGFSVDSFTLSRAKRFGMQATPFTTLVLPLKGE